MRAQVEAVRGLVLGSRRCAPIEAPARRWAAAALLAASMTGLGGAGCDDTSLSTDDGGRKDAITTVGPDVIGGGGVCPVQIQDDAATSSPDSFMGGGICMMPPDAEIVTPDAYMSGGGICAVAAPQETDLDAFPPPPIGGIC
jgi:hypothetical protein